ncbi:MAG: c-type cytochrome [Chloroflexi bacterium]|nr:c-type cytochrome [Chloroflexota bacterium]
MKEEQKQTIHEKYQRALQKGERFWPDSIYKDLVVSFGIFIVLVLMAAFVGVPGEPKADPSDSSYVPKPEWYFLFLFKFLALYGQIPGIGKIEWIATALIPGLALLLLFVLPLTDKNPFRHYTRRTLALTVMGVFVVSVIALTMIANVPTATDENGRMTLSTWLQFLAGLILPGLAYLVLIALTPLARKWGVAARKAQVWSATVASVGMLALGLVVMLTAPPAAASEVEVAGTVGEKMSLGMDLYSVYCTECHGVDGDVTVITGVEGLEGKVVSPISSSDVMYTLTDETLANIIAYGQQGLGMPPFGRAYGGELSPSEIDYIVTYIRYTWDDRAEIPADAVLTSIPELAEGEVPSYEIHISALVKRYCVSCHRAGKDNNNYLMTSYDEMLTTGDNSPVMVAGDAESLNLVLINGTEVTDPKTGNVIRAMPPNKLLDQKYIDMLTLWVLNGMPNTAVEAQALSAPTPTP